MLVALLILLFLVTVAVIGLEVLDQGIDVLVLVFVILGLDLCGGGLDRLLGLLVEVARLDLRVQRRRRVFGHCGVLRKECDFELLLEMMFSNSLATDDATRSQLAGMLWEEQMCKLM